MQPETVGIGLPEALAVFVPDLSAEGRTTIRCCEAALLAHILAQHDGDPPREFEEAVVANTVATASELGIDLVLERRQVAAAGIAEALYVVSGPVRRIDLMEVAIDGAYSYCLWASTYGAPLRMPNRAPNR